MTKISIVIPTFNGERNIKKQIATLINDCKKGGIFNFYEIVICDNCSEDNTKKVVKECIKRNHKNKVVKIKYYSSKVNIGYPLNFIQSTKLAESRYILFLCDDNIPEKNFYIDTYSVFKDRKFDELCFFSTNNINNYKRNSSLNNSVELAYVMNRGSILSGVLVRKSKIKYKYIIKDGLYPQNGVFIDYYLEHGLKIFNFKSKINCKTYEKISDKFNDRMNRKEDLAVIDKINTIDIFYKKKRINIINLFVCLYTIYYWSIDIFLTLKKQKKITIANNFFEAIKKYDRKLLMHLAMKYALLKTFISKLKKYV
jgi:glycosyltransferase involved in cell wall biosynthesis|tara:strand:+ start:2170 stop:3105 length:936 start_codon:yes stop_codon:yes gene_type:complete